MIFMTKKNANEMARFLGRYSIAFDNANDSQKKALMDTLHLDHLMLLDTFFMARKSFQELMTKSNGSV